MEGLPFIVGIIGNIISVLLFLSPAGTFVRIVKNKSTEEFESAPYIFTLLCSSLWTYYGIARPGQVLVATVNGFGVLTELCYLTLFLIFASTPRIRAQTAILFGTLNVGCLGAAVLIARLMFEGDMSINMIGIFGAILNIFMYASPLAALRSVVATKSVEFMPLPLSVCVCVNGGVWTIYAILTDDIYLLIPNATGFVLGVVQLIVYVAYWSRPAAQHEPQYHEHLIP